jgi:hypothetical protein
VPVRRGDHPQVRTRVRDPERLLDVRLEGRVLFLEVPIGPVTSATDRSPTHGADESREAAPVVGREIRPSGMSHEKNPTLRNHSNTKS